MSVFTQDLNDIYYIKKQRIVLNIKLFLKLIIIFQF